MTDRERVLEGFNLGRKQSSCPFIGNPFLMDSPEWHGWEAAQTKTRQRKNGSTGGIKSKANRWPNWAARVFATRINGLSVNRQIHRTKAVEFT